MGTLGPHPRLIRLLSGPRMDVRLHCPVTFTRLPAICQVSVLRSVPVYPGVANVWVRSTSLPITLQGTTMLLRWVPVSSACSSLGPEWAPSLLWVHADSHLTSAVLKKIPRLGLTLQGSTSRHTWKAGKTSGFAFICSRLQGAWRHPGSCLLPPPMLIPLTLPLLPMPGAI